MISNKKQRKPNKILTNKNKTTMKTKIKFLATMLMGIMLSVNVWGDITLTTSPVTLNSFSSISGSGYQNVSNYTISGYSGFSVNQCIINSSNLQLAKNGRVTSPTITSPAGFDIAVTYTSGANFTVQIGDEEAVTSGSVLKASTKSTSTTFTISAGSKYGLISQIVLTPKSAGPKHGVNWNVNGSVWNTTQVAEGATIELPTNPGAPEGCEGKSFFGWTESSSYEDATTAPTIIGDDEEMGTTEVNYYAVFATKELSSSATTAVKIDKSEITNGMTILLVDGDDDAIGNVRYTKDAYFYITPVSLTIVNGIVTSMDTKTKYTVTKSGDYYVFKQGSNYLNMAQYYKDLSCNTENEDKWAIESYKNGYSFQSYNNDDDYYIYGYLVGYIGNADKFAFYLYTPGTWSDFTTTCVTCSKEVNVSKGSMTGGDITISADKVCADGDGGSVTVTPNPNEHYSCTSVTATVGNVTGPAAGVYTVSGITAETTISATFVEDAKATVTWSVNGVTKKSSQVYVGETDAAPAVADADIPTTCANAFVGWSTSTMVGEGYGAPKDLFNTTSPVVSEDVTYYAVFATAGSGSGTVFHSQPGTITSGDYYLVDTYNRVDYQGNATACSYRALKGGLISSSGTFGGIQCVNICDAVSVNDNVLTLDMSHLDDSQKPDAYTITVNESSVSFALNGTTFYCQGDNVNADMTTSTTNSYNWNEITNETGDYVGRHMLKVSHGTGTRCLMVLDHTSSGNNANYCKVYALTNSNAGGTAAKEQSYGSGKLYFIPAVSVTYSNYVTSCATYTVTFKSNGADVTTVSNVAPGQQVTAPTWAEIDNKVAAKNVCTNYLIGWSTNSHYSNPSAAPGDILKPNAEGKITIPSDITSDVTYYAVYADVAGE